MKQFLLSLAAWLALTCPSRAAIAYNWTSIAYNQAPATSVTVSKGANAINTGDLLLVAVGVHGTADPGTIIPPAGFTLAQPNGIAGTFYSATTYGFRYALFCKIAGPSESGSYAFSWTNSNISSWVLLDYSGTANSCATALDGGDEVDTVSGSFTSSFATGAVTTANANDVLVSLWMFRGSGTMTLPTNARTAYNPTGSPAVWIGASDLGIPTAGLQSAQTATYWTTTSSWTAVSFGITAAGITPPSSAPTRALMGVGQ